MNAEQQIKSGYPSRFNSERRCSWIWFCIPVGFLGTFAASFAYVLCIGAGGVLQVLGLAFVTWAIFKFYSGNIEAWQKARLYPYYDQVHREADTYLSGQAILRNCLYLDKLAESKGIKPISNFGFPDALRGEKVIWHDADDGLKTIHGLIQAVTEKPDSVDDVTAVLSDLGKIRYAFEQAKTKGIKFSFLIEDMGGTSALVWERRGGHV